mmetsp:Transcript_51202/g.111068  ORF Transcript_51202/g.111068 Transcript_51202/m.111068 type:complete len:203 (+) Transcript_51202:247-855(+)
MPRPLQHRSLWEKCTKAHACWSDPHCGEQRQSMNKLAALVPQPPVLRKPPPTLGPRLRVPAQLQLHRPQSLRVETSAANDALPNFAGKQAGGHSSPEGPTQPSMQCCSVTLCRRRPVRQCGGLARRERSAAVGSLGRGPGRCPEAGQRQSRNTPGISRFLRCSDSLVEPHPFRELQILAGQSCSATRAISLQPPVMWHIGLH